MFRTSGTWPREKALFAYPMPLAEWPVDPVIVETVRLRSCLRRGAAIDVIADRSPDGLAELQVRWPNVPLVFCETRSPAEEWTYRFLAAAQAWAITEEAVDQRISAFKVDIVVPADAAAQPSTAQVRAWARGAGLPVPDRGKLRPEIWSAWRDAHP